MRRHVTEPLYARWLERDIGVETEGDGLVDDRLLLLTQQFDQPLFGADVALDSAVGVVEIADDGGLLI